MIRKLDPEHVVLRALCFAPYRAVSEQPVLPKSFWVFHLAWMRSWSTFVCLFPPAYKNCKEHQTEEESCAVIERENIPEQHTSVCMEATRAMSSLCFGFESSPYPFAAIIYLEHSLRGATMDRSCGEFSSRLCLHSRMYLSLIELQLHENTS